VCGMICALCEGSVNTAEMVIYCLIEREGVHFAVGVNLARESDNF
jgi:hypothetical protein